MKKSNINDLLHYYTENHILTKGVMVNGRCMIVHQNPEDGLYYASPLNDLDSLFCIAKDQYLKNVVYFNF